jgi:hypothetical protein
VLHHFARVQPGETILIHAPAAEWAPAPASLSPFLDNATGFIGCHLGAPAPCSAAFIGPSVISFGDRPGR